MFSKCNSCGAIYEPTQRDGSRYFHACATEDITHAVCDPISGIVTTAEKRAPRAVVRDETVTGRDNNGVEQIVSEGAGITVLPDETGTK